MLGMCVPLSMMFAFSRRQKRMQRASSEQAEGHSGGRDYNAAERERAGVLRLCAAEVESVGHYGGRAMSRELMAAPRRA